MGKRCPSSKRLDVFPFFYQMGLLHEAAAFLIETEGEEERISDKNRCTLYVTT